MRPKRNTFLLKINRAYASVLLKKRELDGFNIGLYLPERSIKDDLLLAEVAESINIKLTIRRVIFKSNRRDSIFKMIYVCKSKIEYQIEYGHGK